MRRLKQKFNSVIHRHPWALQATMAILIAVCAISFTVTKGLAAESDWPWPDPYKPTPIAESKLNNLQVFKMEGGGTNFFVGDQLRISWGLSEGNTDWRVDLYLLKAGSNENKFNHTIYPIAKGVGANKLSYDWQPALIDARPDVNPDFILPNMHDRYIYAVMYDTSLPVGNQVVDWNLTSPFNIKLWQITQPAGGTLTVGDTTTVSWDTDLVGPGRVYLEVDKEITNDPKCQVINQKSYCWIVKELPLETKSVSWKVGYSQTSLTGEWEKLNSRISGATAHIYLVQFVDQLVWPNRYYPGYDDYDFITPDQQEAFTIQGAPLPVGSDSANPIVYTSPQLNIASTLPVASIDLLKAEYSQPTGSNIKFYIGLFKADGVTPVYVSINGFDASGYYLIPEESEGLLTGSGAVLPSLPDDNLLTEISSARFRVAMSSTDLNLYEPSVTSITLNYTSGTIPPVDPDNIGTIALTDLVGTDGKITQTINCGESKTFGLKITPTNFSGTVVLSVSPITKVSDSTVVSTITSQFDPSSQVTFLTGDIEKTATVRFTVAGGTSVGLYKFTITGHKLDDTSKVLISDTRGQIQVDTCTTTPSNITLNLTIPVEEVSPETFAGSLVHPLFTLRLYNPTTNAKVYENLNFPGNLSTDRTQYTKALTVTRTELPNNTYSAYIRSDRHLWSKSTANLTINNDNIFGITFPTLKVGNVDENNKINMVDFNKISPDYGKEFVNLLGDLNNDGKVNMQDLDWITKNFALWGNQLPDEIRQ